MSGVATGYIPNQSISNKLDVSIFSKHLQFLSYKETGQVAVDLGFDGVDLTVRPKGHVLPEHVAIDLLKAVEEIRSAGSTCKMITTAIESVARPEDLTIIKTAGQLGIQYYRSNWFKYEKGLSMPESLKRYQKQLSELSNFNEKYNIVGCYQNHAGQKVGASYWEIYQLLKNVNPKYFGAQYDIRHAMVEGGKSWENRLRLLHKKLK